MIGKRIISFIMACVVFLSSANTGVYATELNEADVLVEESVYESTVHENENSEVHESTEYEYESEHVQASTEREQESTEVQVSTEREQESTEAQVDTEQVQESTESAEPVESPEVSPVIVDYDDVLDFEAVVMSAEEAGVKAHKAEELIAMGESMPSYQSQSYGHAWDNYASQYIYKYLREDEKQLWDAMEVLCSSYLENEEDIPGYTDYVKVESTELTEEDLDKLVFLFRYAHPQYYYLLNCFSHDMEGFYVRAGFNTYGAFCDGIDRKKATAEVKQQLEFWCEEIAQYDTEEEKVKAIHDIVCNAVDYNHAAVEEGINAVEHKEFTQSAYSVFCSDLTVCNGYAQAFAWLCNAFDIECFTVTSPDHAWNKVKVNDNWYNVDCTWDDGDGAGNFGYAYFLKNDSYMRAAGNHDEEPIWSPYLPDCTLDSGSTYKKAGSVPKVTEQTAAPVITITPHEKGYTVEMTSATEGADIIYTLDGSIPTEANTKGYFYDGVCEINEDAVIKAIAVCDGYLDSEVTLGGEITEIIYMVDTGTAGEDIAWELDSTGKLVLTGSGGMYAYTNAEEWSWASYRRKIEEIQIADGITGLGHYAFAHTKVREIELPDSIINMGYEVFSDCDELTTVKICGAIHNMGENIFADCDGLIKVELPDTLRTIARKMFYSCDSLEQIDLPDNLQKMEFQAFAYCESLKEITIPGTTAMDVNTFQYCKSLEKLTIEEGVTWLPNYSFEGCAALKEVTLPESLEWISGAFGYGCTSLTKIRIPQNVVTIDDDAFDSSVVIYGYVGTEAERYAKEKGNTFVDAFDEGVRVFFVTGIGTKVITRYCKDESLITEPKGLQKNGYELDGWYTSQEVQDDTTRWDFAQDTVKQELTLYAKWRPWSYRVTFDLNYPGAEELENKYVYTDMAYGSLPVPTYKDCEFLYWCLEDGTVITEETSVSIREDHVLYAKWAKKVEALEADIPGGVVKAGTKMSLTTTTEDAKIYYTVDSSVNLGLSAINGTLETDAIRYEDGIEINESCAITAIAVKEGYVSSNLFIQYYTIKDESQDAQSLNVGVENIVNIVAQSEYGTSVYRTFIVPEDGYYDFGFTMLEGDDSIINFELRDDADESENRRKGDVDIRIDEKPHMLTVFLKKGEVLCASFYTYTTAKKQIAVTIQKVPEYVLALQADGSYSGETEQFVLKTEMVAGCKAICGSAYLYTKEGVDGEEKYSFHVYHAKNGEEPVSDYFIMYSMEEDADVYEGDIRIETEEQTKYEMFYVLETVTEDYERIPFAIFKGDMSVTTQKTKKPYVVYKTEVFEDRIILDVESFVDGDIYFAPTDGSGWEQSISFGTSWDSKVFENLKPDTEYYLDFVSHEKVLYGTEIIRTAPSETSYTEITYDISCIWEDGSTKLKVQADVDDYKGKSDIARLYCSYTDIFGRKQVFGSYDVKVLEDDLEHGKDFLVCGEESVELEAGKTYDMECWMEFGNSSTIWEKKVLQFTTPESAIQKEDIVFSLTEGEIDGTVDYTISMGLEEDEEVYATFYYKPCGANVSEYKREWICIRAGESTGTVVEMQTGVAYDMMLFAEGVKIEFIDTIGTARYALVLGEADVNAYDFSRLVEVQAREALNGSYELNVYYRKVDGYWGQFGSAITLDAANEYKTEFESSAYDQLEGVTVYEFKWVLSAEDGSTYTVYDTIRTEKPVLTFEVANSYVGSVECEIRVDEASIPPMGYRGDYLQLYVRKAGTERFRYMGNVSLDGITRIEGLEPETTYEISVRNSDSAQYTEYLSETFTTGEDTRTVEVGTIETTRKQAVIPYTLTGMEDIQTSYVYLYVRKKDAQSEWERHDSLYYHQDWQNAEGEFSIGTNQDAAKFLAADTTYEYLIGFGGERETEDTLRRTVIGEFTTAKDTRKIKVYQEKVYIDCAEISFDLSGIEDVEMLNAYIREKDSEDPWESGGYKFLDAGDTTVEFLIRYSEREDVEKLLKEETTYEYCVGFRNDTQEAGQKTLEQTVYGEFTTAKDMRKVEVTKVHPFFNCAKIYYEVSGLENIEDTILCFYLRKKDSGDEWEECSYTYLGGLDQADPDYLYESYKGEVLEQETTYEYMAGFKAGGMIGTGQGVEDLKHVVKGEFTTVKDIRDCKIAGVSAGVDAIVVDMDIEGLECVYQCWYESYIREKGTEEWVYAGGAGTGYERVDDGYHIIKMADSNIFGVKDETAYEYCVGISDSYMAPMDEMVKKCYGEITTPKDISEIVVTDIKVDSGRARIDFDIKGGSCRTCIGVPLYYREKGSKEWIEAAYTSIANYPNQHDQLQITGIIEETDYEFKIGFILHRVGYKEEELENPVIGGFTTKTDSRKIAAEATAGYMQAKLFMNFSGNDYKKTNYLYGFYKPEGTDKWQNAGFISCKALAGDFSLDVRNLTSDTVYDYAVVIAEERVSSPDEVYIADYRSVGQFTTKGNTYTLTLTSNEEATTYKQAGVTVTAAGGSDAAVTVELTLADESGNTIQTQIVLLKSEKGYTGEVLFTGLMPECKYVITEAKLCVQENGEQIELGTQKPEYQVTTAKVNAAQLAFTEDVVLLNAEYYEEGFNKQALSAKLDTVIDYEDFEWKSSNSSVAKVDEHGVVYAVSRGEAEITVTSKYDAKVCATCKVVVKEYALDAVNNENQELAENNWTLRKGEQLQVSFWANENTGRVEIKDYNVTIEKENIVTWLNGVLTATGAGQTRIIFEKDGVKAAATVSVQLKSVGFGITGLSTSDSSYPALLQEGGSYLIACGEAISYTAVGTISPYQTSDAFKANDFKWSSSNTATAEVDAYGVITPKAAGTTVITVASKNEGAYLQKEVQITLIVRDLPKKELQEPVFVLTNVSSKLGAVAFSEKWSEGWHWKNPNTTFAVSAENEEVYYFEAVYEGTEYYPEEVMVPVHIGTITGLTVSEAGGSHKQILETDGDTLRLVIDAATQGVVDEKMYQIELPTVKGLLLSENEDGSYTVQAEKAGSFTLKPIITVDGKTLKLKKAPSYKITAVKDKQAASIELGLAPEESDVTIDKASGRIVLETLEKEKTFVVTASVKDRSSESIATKLEWKSTDAAVVKVKADSKDSHKATVTVVGAGNAVIIVTAKDKVKVQEKLEIEIQDHAPRINTLKMTVNLAYDYQETYGKELAAKEGVLEIIPVYGEKITKIQLIRKTGKLVNELSVEKYGEYSYLLVPKEEKLESIKTGKEDYILRVTGSETGRHEYPLTVTFTEKKPTVKVKKNNAVNLFYKDLGAEITFNVSNNARIESAEWRDGTDSVMDGFSMYGGSYETSPGKYVSYVQVGQQEELVIVNKKPQDASVIKGTLRIKLAGYRTAYVFENFSVKYTYKKPTIVSKEASTTVAPELGQNTNHFTLYNKTLKGDVYYTLGGSTSSNFNEITCSDSNIELKTKPYNDITYTYKGTQKSCNFKMQISSDKWREAVEVAHTVKVKNPTLKLADGTITFNLYENLKSSASTSLTVTNGVDVTLTDIMVTGKNSKAANLIEKNLLVFTTNGYQIHVTQNDAGQMGETLPTGTYDYKVTPYYISAADGTKKALPALSLKVKIINKAVSASVSAKGSIDLANGTAFDVSAKKNVMWIEPKFTNLATGDEVTGYKLIGDYSHCFILENGDGHDYIKVNLDKLGSLKANQTYKLAVEYTLCTADGTEYAVTSKTFNVKPKQSNPKVTLRNNNQVFYAAANTLCRYYDISVPDYYRMESVSGGYDCDKDGIADIMVSTDHMDAEGR
ncbi:MAG: leucine-rich repeat protein, partial [Lachnospiraceae bacterium]|nr:leucine-rich repeat protein [Lachnospiraceae bacterium]